MRRSFYVHNTDSFASLPPRRSFVSPSSSSPLIATKGLPTAEGALPPRPENHLSRSSMSIMSSSQEDTLESGETRFERSTSRPPSQRNPRPKSYASSSRRSSMRGPPHHNNVEIVLPAPLAVLHNSSESIQSINQTPNRPTSMYDQWTPPLSRSTSRSRLRNDAEESSRANRVRQNQAISIPPVPPVPSIYSSGTHIPSSREPSPTANVLRKESRSRALQQH